MRRRGEAGSSALASSPSEDGEAPSRYAFYNAVQRAADSLHGLVGASFLADLLVYAPVSRLRSAGAGVDEDKAQPAPSSICAVFKVATPHAPTLASTIAAGIHLVGSNGAAPYTCRYAGTLSAFDLSALGAMASTFTTADADGAGAGAGAAVEPGVPRVPSVAAPSALGPPGRAWFESLVKHGSSGHDVA